MILFPPTSLQNCSCFFKALESNLIFVTENYLERSENVDMVLMLLSSLYTQKNYLEKTMLDQF